MFRRPRVGSLATITMASVHSHNSVAKEEDAVAVLLHKLAVHAMDHDIGIVAGEPGSVRLLGRDPC